MWSASSRLSTVVRGLVLLALVASTVSSWAQVSEGKFEAWNLVNGSLQRDKFFPIITYGHPDKITVTQSTAPYQYSYRRAYNDADMAEIAAAGFNVIRRGIVAHTLTDERNITKAEIHRAHKYGLKIIINLYPRYLDINFTPELFELESHLTVDDYLETAKDQWETLYANLRGSTTADQNIYDATILAYEICDEPRLAGFNDALEVIKEEEEGRYNIGWLRDNHIAVRGRLVEMVDIKYQKLVRWKEILNQTDSLHPVLNNYADFYGVYAKYHTDKTWAQLTGPNDEWHIIFYGAMGDEDVLRAAYRTWRNVADIYEMDSYGVAGNTYPQNYLSTVVANAAELNDIVEHGSATDLPVTMILQACAFDEMSSALGHGQWPDQRPNLTETRFVTYGSIINGARGISYFNPSFLTDSHANSQTWADLKQTAGEVSALQKVLLEGNVITSGYSVDCVGGNCSGATSQLMSLCIEHNGLYYLIVTNGVGAGSNFVRDVRISFQGWNVDRVRVMFEDDRPLTLANRSFTDSFDCWDTHVYAFMKDGLPIGSFETPGNNTTVRSSVPVTGWALASSGIKKVQLFRVEGQQEIFIGDAVLVEGARPDAQRAYPGYPGSELAGWGYMMLTNMLPANSGHTDLGNGTYTLRVRVTDNQNRTITLGEKVITADNANAVKPFGAIDTPAQGYEINDADLTISYPSDPGNMLYRIEGWVLTPPPNWIDTQGATIKLWIDGVESPHVKASGYDFERDDIADLFPSYLNAGVVDDDFVGAKAYFDVDMSEYANGLHTVAWVVTDNAGNQDGVGSRYFKLNLSTSAWPVRIRTGTRSQTRQTTAPTHSTRARRIRTRTAWAMSATTANRRPSKRLRRALRWRA